MNAGKQYSEFQQAEDKDKLINGGGDQSISQQQAYPDFMGGGNNQEAGCQHPPSKTPQAKSGFADITLRHTYSER